MSDQLLGPFSVKPTQVASLGAAFTPLVNELLRREVAAAALSGTVLTTTYQENVGDEGVDAGLIRAVETRFIPEGDSAWQFKRGDLPPAACKSELEGASAALEILPQGVHRPVGELTLKPVHDGEAALRAGQRPQGGGDPPGVCRGGARCRSHHVPSSWPSGPSVEGPATLGALGHVDQSG